MWLMLEADAVDDYIIATGELHSVRELVECAFAYVGLDWNEHVEIDGALVRGKAELRNLVGDASKPRRRLGWEPNGVFEELFHPLIDTELTSVRVGQISEMPKPGFPHVRIAAR